MYILYWGAINRCLVLTFLMFIVPEHAARDSPVIFLNRTNVLGIGCRPRVSLAVASSISMMGRTILNGCSRHR